MPVLAIHGGAGGDGEWRGLTLLDPERIQCMHHVLESIGNALASGTIDALEAVTQAVELMEDEPLFNAGIGSVLDEDGTVTMDASIMNGSDGAAGSVVNVREIRHPIRCKLHSQARLAVMLNSGLLTNLQSRKEKELNLPCSSPNFAKTVEALEGTKRSPWRNR